MIDMNSLEQDAWMETSVALMEGRIRTNKDVARDIEKIRKYHEREIFQEKLKNFYLHLNPINYFRKEKPYGWY
jgi:hypothetical protein